MAKEMIDAGDVNVDEEAPSAVETALDGVSADEGDIDIEVDPDPIPVPESDDESAPAPAEEVDVIQSEEDLLKAYGIEGHKTVDEMIAAQKNEVSELINMFRTAGWDTKASSVAELKQDLMAYLMQSQGQQGNAPDEQYPAQQGNGQGGPPMGLQQVYQKYGDALDESNQQFYNDYGRAVIQEVTKSLGDVPSRLSQVSESTDVLLDLHWYNEAKAQAGDGPIPPLAEARQLLSNSKNLRDAAKFGLMRFGNGTNPMLQVFNVWRAGKLPSGITNADKAERDKAAKKLAIQKGLVSPTSATRSKAKTFSELSAEEQTATLDKMPA